MNREELFSTIQRVYSQNIPSQNINANLSERMDETQKNDRRYWDKEKNIKRDKLQRVVYTYAELAGVNEQEAIEGLIERLTNLNINDSIDTILVSLSGLLDRKALTAEQILSNSDLILALNPDKYKKEKVIRIYKSKLDSYKNINDKKIKLLEIVDIL